MGRSDNPELAEAQDGSITSNLVSQPSATPGMNMRTPLARVGYFIEKYVIVMTFSIFDFLIFI